MQLSRRDSKTHDKGYRGYWPWFDRSGDRAGTSDEVAQVAALLMGPVGAFITGSDFLMDGGVTSSYWFGDLASK